MLLPGFVHPVGAATPARSRFGGLIRSLPDSLPRVVACYLPAQKCFLWPAPYDVAHQAQSIVAEQYEFVIGVDTHPATHTLSVITAATGAVIDQAVFSTTPSGLDRALTWIPVTWMSTLLWWSSRVSDPTVRG